MTDMPATTDQEASDDERAATVGHNEVLLSVRNLIQEFAVRDRGGVRGGVVHAVSDVSFDLAVGETLGLVGETGSGKSTIARSLLQAPKPKSGSVRFQNRELTALRGRALTDARRNVQMIFQDPFASLNRKWKVAQIVEEGLIAHGLGDAAERARRVDETLNLVGLAPEIYRSRRPRQLSGGQCQRVAIARALALSPALLICDEVVASLDVLVQAQILNLFEQLRRELGLSYLFIAHDLALVKQVSDRIAVLYLGKLAEIGPTDSIFERPLHPYTVALLSSIPIADVNAPTIAAGGRIDGEPPSPIDPPSGCRFRTRCPRVQDRCAEEEPSLRELEPGHWVSCHFPVSPDDVPEAVRIAIRTPPPTVGGQARPSSDS